jgi:hypothetical protein
MGGHPKEHSFWRLDKNSSNVNRWKKLKTFTKNLPKIDLVNKNLFLQTNSNFVAVKKLRKVTRKISGVEIGSEL